MSGHAQSRSRPTPARRPSGQAHSQPADLRHLHQWIDTVRKAFPHLSKPQASVLALWSFGMILARSCALTAVSLMLAILLGRQPNTLQQRLREFYQEAQAKCGRRRRRKKQRRQLEVSTCFAPLLRWIVGDGLGPQLAVALDATSLGSRFVVLAVSVLYRGSAIPVAWKVLRANVPHPWRAEWLHLLQRFHSVVPAGWTVIALTDRGLWAKWLYQGIRDRGWHPLMRINLEGKFRPEGWFHFVPLGSLVRHVGALWRGRGTAFATPGAQLPCTLLASWGEGHEEPWLLLTDLAPEQAEPCWYGLRAWIEQGFKDHKHDGWQWQGTRMTDPARAERLWLAMAVATLWLLRVGGEAEAGSDASPWPEIPLLLWDRGPEPRRRRWRLVSVFRRGWMMIIVALMKERRLPLGRLVPEPWPLTPPLPNPAEGGAGVRMIA